MSTHTDRDDANARLTDTHPIASTAERASQAREHDALRDRASADALMAQAPLRAMAAIGGAAVQCAVITIQPGTGRIVALAIALAAYLCALALMTWILRRRAF